MTTKRKDRIFWRMGTNGKMVETAKHHCETPYCRGVVNRRTERSPYCTRCRWDSWRAKNPLRYSFGNLRRRAKQRGKVFTLTLEQYAEFVNRTDFLKFKGKTSQSLSVHRRDNDKGYTADNVVAISLGENARKPFVEFYRRQFENQAYQPTPDEIRQIEAAL